MLCYAACTGDVALVDRSPIACRNEYTMIINLIVLILKFHILIHITSVHFLSFLILRLDFLSYIIYLTKSSRKPSLVVRPSKLAEHGLLVRCSYRSSICDGLLVCLVLGGVSACFLLAVSSFIGRVVFLKIVSRSFLFGTRLVVFGRDFILPVAYVRIFD